jgi:DNA-binding GntR family transcriptional regulator
VGRVGLTEVMAPTARRTASKPRDVYAQLRDLIVHGQVAPGARLVETELALRLGVSRTPLRAALQRLQQEGYVIAGATAQQARHTVSPMTSGDANELFLLVGTLEAQAARQTALLPAVARHALADRLKATNDDLKRAASGRRPNHDRLFELDERFHRFYVEAGAGPRLLALHRAVKPQAERYERLYVSLLMSEIMVSVQEHTRIHRAIRDGAHDAAFDAVLVNWRNAASRLGSVIAQAGERGSW